MMKEAFQNKVESEFGVKESENPSDFRFAKKYRNLTTFGYEFELCHIPS